MLDNVIGVSEASEITGLAEGTIKNYCANGNIEAKKIGKTWVIDKIKLEENVKMEKIMNRLRRAFYVNGEIEKDVRYATLWESKEHIETDAEVDVFESNQNVDIDTLKFPIIEFDGHFEGGEVFESGVDMQDVLDSAEDFFKRNKDYTLINELNDLIEDEEKELADNIIFEDDNCDVVIICDDNAEDTDEYFVFEADTVLEAYEYLENNNLIK